MSKPTIPEVLPLVWAYRDLPGNGVGGALHIVLDDGNIDDSSILFCKKYAEERGDVNGARLCKILLKMSKTQRAALSHRFYNHDPEPGAQN